MGAQSLKAEDLRWIVCPVCRQSLQLEAAVIQCEGCGRRYPVEDGIPILLADRAVLSIG